MKHLFIFFFLFTTISHSQTSNENYIKWQEMAEEDISLQPEYGNIEKTEEQKQFDATFIAETMKKIKDTAAASEKMAELGFQYLYERGDFVTSMRRFNQAYLLNPKNADAYHGFGTIYLNLGAMEEAREQFDKGLKIDPEHPELLAEYGTTYLGDYYQLFDTDRDKAEESLEKAMEYFSKSYKIDNKNSDTAFKLAIVNMYEENCSQAKKYLKQAKSQNNPNVTQEFEDQLKETCD